MLENAIPACDRQTDRRTDGIAVASTALAIRALRSAEKNGNKLNTNLRIMDDQLLLYALAAVSAILIARSTLLKKKRRKHKLFEVAIPKKCQNPFTHVKVIASRR